MDCIQLQLSSDDAKAVAQYMREEIECSDYRDHVRIELPSFDPAGAGYELPLTPDLTIAFAKGVATGVGAGAGRFIWNRLRQYFKARKVTGTLVVAEANRQVLIDCDMIPDDPPSLNPS